MAIEDGYSICLNEWALDKSIKNELNLLIIISSLTASEGYCFASNSWFAELFEIDEVSVSRKLKKLEQAGYITIDYKKRGFEITNREIRLTKMLTVDSQDCKSSINKNVNRPLTKMLTVDSQDCKSSINKNVNYNNTSINITNKKITNTNNKGVGGHVDQNNKEILEEKEQIKNKKILKPTLPAGVQLPVKVKSKLVGMEETAKKALTDYCLFLIDAYNFKDTALCNRIDEVCRAGRNIPQAIEVICSYNINGNYRKMFTPNDLKSTVIKYCAISQAGEDEDEEDDFIRDENGNIEEIW